LTKYQKNKRREVRYYSELELVHNRFNKHDRFALEVYLDNVFIGYVRKVYEDTDKSIEINNLCFDSGFLKNIYIDYNKNQQFVIAEAHSDASLEKNQTYQKRVDNILFKIHNIPMDETEALTIKHALKYKDEYELSEKEVSILKTRLAVIVAENTGNAGREIGLATAEAAEKILGETFGLAGKALDFFRK
jgi:hypothetical protein